jgi:hypothetical protein
MGGIPSEIELGVSSSEAKAHSLRVKGVQAAGVALSNSGCVSW